MRRLYSVFFTLALLGSMFVPKPLFAQDDEPISHQIPTISSGGEMAGMSISTPPEPSEEEPVPDVVTSTQFEGFGYDDNATENGGFVSIPPDPMGAAGPSSLVAVVNTMIEARTKTGGLIFRDSLQDFFSGASPAPVTRTFDPKVIYDHYENRFVVVTLERQFDTGGLTVSANNTSRIFVAVSKTSAPATATSADWYYLSINSKETIAGNDVWADYPGFEVDEEAIYITNNMFQHNGAGSFQGTRLWIIDKGVVGGFYNGGVAIWNVHNPYAGGGFARTSMPALVYGTGGIGGAGSAVGTYLIGYEGLEYTITGNEAIQLVRINNPLSATPTFTIINVDVGNQDNASVFPLPSAPQPGTASTLKIAVNDRRIYDAVWRNNKLWFVTTILPISGADAGQSTAHWIQLNATDTTVSFADRGNIGAEDLGSGTFTFFPSVAVNSQDDVKFGFAASGSALFAGAYATGRQAADPAGTVQATETVKAGEATYERTFGGSRNRWGDYTGISLDPTDDNAFWVFNEFADSQSTTADAQGYRGRWGTAWAKCSFDATAVELASFTSRAGKDSVTLAWTTAVEIDNAGFNLYRSDSAEGPWVKVNDALIPANGDPVSTTDYTFTDFAQATYYILEDVDTHGNATQHDAVSTSDLVSGSAGMSPAVFIPFLQ